MSSVKRTTHVENHAHISFGAPPKYSPGEIVRVLKSRSAKVVFREFPEVRGEFWSDGYFVRSVVDQVTAEVIRKYIEYHDNKYLVFDF